jgi:phage baseplate assembly protein W
MSSIANKFIGLGWKFPVEFDSHSGSVAMCGGEESITNSLKVLFATAIGERVMRPDYGSELDSFVFETPGRSVLTYMEAVVSNAILFNEPRIILDEVKIQQQGSDLAMLLITVSYTIAATNSRYNFVYPFYLNEATNL